MNTFPSGLQVRMESDSGRYSASLERRFLIDGDLSCRSDSKLFLEISGQRSINFGETSGQRSINLSEASGRRSPRDRISFIEGDLSGRHSMRSFMDGETGRRSLSASPEQSFINVGDNFEELISTCGPSTRAIVRECLWCAIGSGPDLEIEELIVEKWIQFCAASELTPKYVSVAVARRVFDAVCETSSADNKRVVIKSCTWGPSICRLAVLRYPKLKGESSPNSELTALEKLSNRILTPYRTHRVNDNFGSIKSFVMDEILRDVGWIFRESLLMILDKYSTVGGISQTGFISMCTDMHISKVLLSVSLMASVFQASCDNCVIDSIKGLTCSFTLLSLSVIQLQEHPKLINLQGKTYAFLLQYLVPIASSKIQDRELPPFPVVSSLKETTFDSQDVSVMNVFGSNFNLFGAGLHCRLQLLPEHQYLPVVIEAVQVESEERAVFNIPPVAAHHPSTDELPQEAIVHLLNSHADMSTYLFTAERGERIPRSRRYSLASDSCSDLSSPLRSSFGSDEEFDFSCTSQSFHSADKSLRKEVFFTIEIKRLLDVTATFFNTRLDAEQNVLIDPQKSSMKCHYNDTHDKTTLVGTFATLVEGIFNAGAEVPSGSEAFMTETTWNIIVSRFDVPSHDNIPFNSYCSSGRTLTLNSFVAVLSHTVALSTHYDSLPSALIQWFSGGKGHTYFNDAIDLFKACKNSDVQLPSGAKLSDMLLTKLKQATIVVGTLQVENNTGPSASLLTLSPRGSIGSRSDVTATKLCELTKLLDTLSIDVRGVDTDDATLAVQLTNIRSHVETLAASNRSKDQILARYAQQRSTIIEASKKATETNKELLQDRDNLLENWCECAKYIIGVLQQMEQWCDMQEVQVRKENNVGNILELSVKFRKQLRQISDSGQSRIREMTRLSTAGLSKDNETAKRARLRMGNLTNDQFMTQTDIREEIREYSEAILDKILKENERQARESRSQTEVMFQRSETKTLYKLEETRQQLHSAEEDYEKRCKAMEKEIISAKLLHDSDNEKISELMKTIQILERQLVDEKERYAAVERRRRTSAMSYDSRRRSSVSSKGEVSSPLAEFRSELFQSNGVELEEPQQSPSSKTKTVGIRRISIDVSPPHSPGLLPHRLLKDNETLRSILLDLGFTDQEVNKAITEGRGTKIKFSPTSPKRRIHLLEHEPELPSPSHSMASSGSLTPRNHSLKITAKEEDKELTSKQSFTQFPDGSTSDILLPRQKNLDPKVGLGIQWINDGTGFRAGNVVENSLAYEFGVKTGMKLLRIESKAINTAFQLQRGLQAIKARDVIVTFEVKSLKTKVSTKLIISEIKQYLNDMKEIIITAKNDMSGIASSNVNNEVTSKDSETVLSHVVDNSTATGNTVTDGIVSKPLSVTIPTAQGDIHRSIPSSLKAANRTSIDEPRLENQVKLSHSDIRHSDEYCHLVKALQSQLTAVEVIADGHNDAYKKQYACKFKSMGTRIASRIRPNNIRRIGELKLLEAETVRQQQKREDSMHRINTLTQALVTGQRMVLPGKVRTVQFNEGDEQCPTGGFQCLSQVISAVSVMKNWISPETMRKEVQTLTEQIDVLKQQLFTLSKAFYRKHPSIDETDVSEWLTSDVKSALKIFRDYKLEKKSRPTPLTNAIIIGSGIGNQAEVVKASMRSASECVQLIRSLKDDRNQSQQMKPSKVIRRRIVVGDEAEVESQKQEHEQYITAPYPPPLRINIRPPPENRPATSPRLSNISFESTTSLLSRLMGGPSCPQRQPFSAPLRQEYLEPVAPHSVSSLHKVTGGKLKGSCDTHEAFKMIKPLPVPPPPVCKTDAGRLIRTRQQLLKSEASV